MANLVALVAAKVHDSCAQAGPALSDVANDLLTLCRLLRTFEPDQNDPESSHASEFARSKRRELDRLSLESVEALLDLEQLVTIIKTAIHTEESVSTSALERLYDIHLQIKTHIKDFFRLKTILDSERPASANAGRHRRQNRYRSPYPMNVGNETEDYQTVEFDEDWYPQQRQTSANYQPSGTNFDFSPPSQELQQPVGPDAIDNLIIPPVEKMMSVIERLAYALSNQTSKSQKAMTKEIRRLEKEVADLKLNQERHEAGLHNDGENSWGVNSGEFDPMRSRTPLSRPSEGSIPNPFLHQNPGSIFPPFPPAVSPQCWPPPHQRPPRGFVPQNPHGLGINHPFPQHPFVPPVQLPPYQYQYQGRYPNPNFGYHWNHSSYPPPPFQPQWDAPSQEIRSEPLDPITSETRWRERRNSWIQDSNASFFATPSGEIHRRSDYPG